MPLDPLDMSYMGELKRHRDSGWNIVSLNVGYASQTLEQHVLALAAFRRWVKERSNAYMLIETVADIEEAASTGRLGICFDVEGMGPLNGGRLDLVQLFHDLGVRWMLVAYNKATDVGSGCFDEVDGGLTSYGREILAEMKRVGMVVCCSHTGERTTLDVCAAADNPVILSHSNPRMLWEHRRNVPDAIIKAVADTSGVIGLNGLGLFLGENDASTATFVRHIDYVVQLVGPDHAGLSLDYCFSPADLDAFFLEHPDVFPGWTSGVAMQSIEPERRGEIAEGLLRLNYSEADVAKIMGGNWLRIAQTVWR
jgi:membrane dipeptidase